MTGWTLVIPTAGDETSITYLPGIVDTAGPEHCIIIHTRPESPHYPGAVNLDDYGPINIHAWWTTGIQAATTDYVAVANDDISINHDTLPALARALDATGATIAHPWHHKAHIHGPHNEGMFNITGCLWMLNRTHGILPDTSYRWWFGDNDLAIRALNDGNGVATTNEPWYQHHTPNRRTSTNPQLQALAAEDRNTFAKHHPWFF